MKRVPTRKAAWTDLRTLEASEALEIPLGHSDLRCLFGSLAVRKILGRKPLYCAHMTSPITMRWKAGTLSLSVRVIGNYVADISDYDVCLNTSFTFNDYYLMHFFFVVRFRTADNM